MDYVMVLSKYIDDKMLTTSTSPNKIASLAADEYVQYSIFKIHIYLNGKEIDTVVVPNNDSIRETLALMKKVHEESNITFVERVDENE